MKQACHHLLCLLFLALPLSAIAQEKKTVKSNLKDATVFFQGAELTHDAVASLSKGENEIYIGGLSPDIDRNSLKVKTTNGVIISAHEFSVDYLAESKPLTPAIKKLQDSIDYYNRNLELIDTDIEVTANLLSLLQKGMDKNVSGSEKGLGIDELVKTMDYYKTKATALQQTQAANKKKRNDYSSDLSRLKKQLEQESLKNNKATGVLKLNLSSPQVTNCTFTVSYFTTAASWVPFYDINIASTDKPVTIVAKSNVRQVTGIDWGKVNLTLSTATPSNGKNAPLFTAWFLDYIHTVTGSEFSKSRKYAAQNSFSYDQAPMLQEEVAIRSAAENAPGAKPLIFVNGAVVSQKEADAIDPDMIKSIEVLKEDSAKAIYGTRGVNGVILITLKNGMDDYVSQTENALNMVYHIDMPYTIPGNGKEQRIDLQKKEAHAEYKYYCAPKLDTETYLLAEISNWESLNLLTGKANVTYDGTYVGETIIDANSTQEKLTLTLGTDKRVPVKREKLQDLSGSRFLGNDIKQTFTYRLTVRNNQNRPVKMVLKDQYPISTKTNIEVEFLTKGTTPWTAHIEELGVITWEEVLNAGETKTYQISYSVKYPKGSKLNL